MLHCYRIPGMWCSSGGRLEMSRNLALVSHVSASVSGFPSSYHLRLPITVPTHIRAVSHHASPFPCLLEGKTSLDLNEARDDGVWGCSGISWTRRKQSAPRSRQTTTPIPHHSSFTGRMLFLTPNNSVKALSINVRAL